MLDTQFIRDNPEKVKEATEQKGVDRKVVDRVLEADEKRRELIGKVEELKRERNELLKGVTGKPDEVTLAKGKKIKKELAKLEPELKKVEGKFEQLMREIPNPPAEDVKPGKDESENEVLRTWGKKPEFEFEPKDHLVIGEALDIIDVERAAKVSGTRFGYLKGTAVLLELALIQFALETLTKEGFIPVIPPVLIKKDMTEKLGYWEHEGHGDYYWVLEPSEEQKGFYLVGTAEHSIVPMHRDEVIRASELPKRYVAFSSCFRREAGSYGKDTRGIFRVHQFDKVEMVSITKPEESDKEHEYLLSLEEKLFQALELSYQVVKMCSGDLGAPAAKKYDLEIWFPSQNKYRELTSTSNTTDFQARRLNIKYNDGKATKYVHMLNGTAFAIGRTIAAVLENYQLKDGSVKVPQILQSYLGTGMIKRV
ncbi:MAG: hypothetical protein ACD_52C00082G0001 [uncultured bacterium]|nr:MAG: hypothetical protein ACD_52C00082G0001 [uncultured bacterium]